MLPILGVQGFSDCVSQSADIIHDRIRGGSLTTSRESWLPGYLTPPQAPGTLLSPGYRGPNLQYTGLATSARANDGCYPFMRQSWGDRLWLNNNRHNECPPPFYSSRAAFRGHESYRHRDSGPQN